MKILQVVPFFTPARGGSVIVPYNLSKHLAERGHEVTIYTTDFELDRNYIKSLGGVRVVPFHCIANIGMMLISPEMKGQLKKEIRNFDVVHMHNFRSYQNNIIHYYARKHGIPYVLQAHGSLPRLIEKQRRKKLYDLVWGNKIVKDASKLIAVSKEEAEYALQMGINDRKTFIIYNGMDIDSFKNLPEYGRFKKKYGIKGTMILYLGRINKSKGIDFLINAFSMLIKGINDSVLVIAGPDDGHKVELEKLIEKLNLNNRVKFTGYVTEDDKISAYVDADLFVHTVRYMGGVGLTPLEAILCGTPVIVTAECGEVIKEANCGYLVRYGDIEELKEKMRLVIENPEEGKEMVKRGERYIEENLTWEMVGKKVEEIYEDCTS